MKNLKILLAIALPALLFVGCSGTWDPDPFIAQVYDSDAGTVQAEPVQKKPKKKTGN